MEEEVDDNNNRDNDEVAIGELIWAKIEGFPWWPSIILEVKEPEKKSGKQKEWLVSFLGEKSYQYLTRQKIRKWTYEAKKKEKKFKHRSTFNSAMAYANAILSNELLYDDHQQYIDCLDKNLILPGEQGVKQFKELLASEQSSIAAKDKADKKNNVKGFINSELTSITQEMEVIKKNMNEIMSRLPPDELMRLFPQIDFSDKAALCDKSTIDSKMALLNYLEFLCEMFKIPYEANQTLGELIKELNK